MTYKIRQEVLRDAADWMDVCENSGIIAKCKVDGYMMHVSECSFMQTPKMYEFPLALLEGKEVWVGSELYTYAGNKFIVSPEHSAIFSGCSWNPPKPKPKTVMVEMLVEDVRYYANEKVLTVHEIDALIRRRESDCKKALENLK